MVHCGGVLKKYEKFGDESISQGLKERLGDNFDMEKFSQELVKYNKDGNLDEIQEMLICFTDFVRGWGEKTVLRFKDKKFLRNKTVAKSKTFLPCFKKKILDYKKFKHGGFSHMKDLLTVNNLQNNFNFTTTLLNAGDGVDLISMGKTPENNSPRMEPMQME